MRVQVYLLTLLFKFLLGAAHLLQEPLAGVQSCKEGCRCQPSGIHVALPVGTYDHSALAVHHAPGQDGVGTFGVDFRQQQGRCPTEDGVAVIIRYLFISYFFPLMV